MNMFAVLIKLIRKETLHISLQHICQNGPHRALNYHLSFLVLKKISMSFPTNYEFHSVRKESDYFSLTGQERRKCWL